MKLFKHIYLVIGMSGCCYFLSSCSGEEPDALFPTLGTVNKQVELTVESDTYGQLIPSNPGRFITEKADENGQRVLLNVRFTDGSPTQSEQPKKVEVTTLYKVLTKEADDLRIHPTEDPSIFGDTPIQITGSSISKEHLNIQFNVSGNNLEIPHRISLILDNNTKLDEEGLLHVELRHNPESDQLLQRFWGVVSFTLSSIPEYDQPECNGFRIYYNSGADSQATWVVKKGQATSQTEQESRSYCTQASAV